MQVCKSPGIDGWVNDPATRGASHRDEIRQAHTTSTGCCIRRLYRKAEAEGYAARHTAHGPNPASVCFDDGPADCQSHAHPCFLRGEKRLKNLLKVHMPHTVILHVDLHVVRFAARANH